MNMMLKLLPQALVLRVALAALLLCPMPRGVLAQSALPIFDAHIHYSHDAWDQVPTNAVIALMRKAGLQSALVSSSNDDGTQRLYEAAPDLIIPSLRPYKARSELSRWQTDPQALAMVEQRLKTYRYAAFGEFHVSGEAADQPNVKRMMQLAVQHNLILHAHSDAEAIERLFRQQPQAKILWAHSGFERPSAIAALLRKHKNLWADLAYRSEMGADGKVDAQWAAMFNDFPDRFMVGTDTFTPERLHYIPEHANFSRAWLSGLPAGVAQNIAFKNAQALIGPVWAVNRQRAKPSASDGGADAIDPCQSSDTSTPPQSVANGTIRVLYRAVPATISVGKPFSLLATVCPLSTNAQVQSFGVDAQMPEHRHGMNYTPKIATIAPHSYRADGLMFHMPGKWQLMFDVRVDERRERLTHDLVIR
jgi:hypothetical protein